MDSQNLLSTVLFLIISDFEEKLKTGNLDIKQNEIITYFFCKGIIKTLQNSEMDFLSKYQQDIFDEMIDLAGLQWNKFADKMSNAFSVADFEEYKNLKNFNLSKIDKIIIDLSGVKFLEKENGIYNP